MKKMLQKMLALTAVVLLSAGYANAQIVPATVLTLPGAEQIDEMGGTVQSYTNKYAVVDGNTLVVNACALYDNRASQTWFGAVAGGTATSNWTAPAGSVFQGNAYYGPNRIFAVSSSRTVSFRVTNCESVIALVSTENNGRDITLSAYEVVEGAITDASETQTVGGTNAVYQPTLTGLDSSKEYIITVTTNSTSNSRFYEIAFTSPSAAVDPTTDATLSDLMVNGITIDGFSPTTDTYVVSVPNGTTDTGNTYNVTATTNAAEASVEITPTQLTFGNVTIAVTAADGETTKEYYITFEEAPETPNFISLYFATGSSTYSFTNAATGELSGDVCSAQANNASPHCLPNGIESGRRTSNITNFSITLNSTSVQDLILYLRAGGSNPARQLETVSIDDVDVTEAVTITNNSISTSGYTALTIESLNAEIGSVINFIFSANVAFNYLDVTPMVSEPGDGTSLENTIASSRIVFDGQNIFNLEGALLEVFDTTGRVVVRSSNEVIDLSGMQGIFIVKSAKETMKIAVTK